MSLDSRRILRVLSHLTAASCLIAQTKSGADVLIFPDGEKLIGELKSATDSKVVFKSDMGFEVTVEWSKIQELRSGNKFAAIPKEVVLRNSADAGRVPQGTLDMTNQNLAVSAPPAPPQSMPVTSVRNLVEERSFEQAFHNHSLIEGWRGVATLGVGFTEGTQKVNTVTTSMGVERLHPWENWLRPRDKTLFAFNSAYGSTSQTGLPTIKTSLYQATLEHDFFFRPRAFVFGGGTWGHNSAQGLDFTQAYGGGLGLVVFKGEHRQWDVRADLGYTNQQFTKSKPSEQLIGSRFGQTYTQIFAHGITFFEDAGIRPAWNNDRALFASGTSTLTVPVFHQFGVAISAFDSFINDPPPGFKKNTFQLTIGATYTIR